MAQKKALVTGAYGFVGRHCARVLQSEGYSVQGIGHGSWNRPEWTQFGLSNWRNMDITVDALATYVEAPDVILHCAGSGSVAYSLSHPYQDFQRSVTTTLAVLEFMRLHAQNAQLVIPSSAGVYGFVEKMPIAVDAPHNPVSPYGVHKKVLEELCISFARHFKLQISIVRLFSIYGIGLRKQLLWDACNKLSRHEMAFAGTGRETRDLLHVDDAAELMVKAAQHASAKCPIANGGTGTATEIRQVLEAVSSALECPQTLTFSGHARAGDPVHYQAEISQALAWGWTPRRRLASEIASYVEWFKRGAP